MADIKVSTTATEQMRQNEHETWFYSRDTPEVPEDTIDLLVNYSKWDASEIVPQVKHLVGVNIVFSQPLAVSNDAFHIP